MEIIFGIIFSIVFTVGIFCICHVENTLFTIYGKLKFQFDNVVVTAMKLLVSVLFGSVLGIIGGLVWPVTLSFIGLVGLVFGIAYALKRFSNTIG